MPESFSDIALAHSIRSLGAHFPDALGSSTESDDMLVDVWLFWGWLMLCISMASLTFLSWLELKSGASFGVKRAVSMS